MKVAIITGTSSGMGEAFARALLDLDWKVYGISRRENIELTKHENFRQIFMDLSQELEVETLDEKIGEKHLDLLVNNAGINFSEPINSWDAKNANKMFALNYHAPMSLTTKLTEKLNGGMVINILSILSHMGWKGYEFGLYGASKAALWSHMYNFSIQNPEIIVYNLHPTSTNTTLLDTLGYDDITEEREEYMTIKNISKVLIQLVSRFMMLTSGSSIFLHNDWQLEDIKELNHELYTYNVDTEKLTKI